MTFREASELWHRYEDANRERGYVEIEDSEGRRLVQSLYVYGVRSGYILQDLDGTEIERLLPPSAG